MENNSPSVSIVLTTKNEQKNIRACLQSIEDQTYKNIEMIVVDNESTDLTLRWAKAYTDNIYLKGPERSAQRNWGIGKAKGEYVMYLDADMILEKNLVEECIKQIKDADALYIPEVIMGTSFLSKIRRYERSYYSGTVIDASRFFVKEKFIKTGGFNTELVGPEDWEMDLKIKKNGGKIHLLENSWINHDESNINLKDYLNKKSYYATSFDKYKKKWGADDPDIKKQLGFYYRFIQVFIEQGKWKKLLRHPILTLGMYYLRFRVGIRYLRRNRK